MAKKLIELHLTYDIPTLIEYQEYVVKSLHPRVPKEAVNLQKDILALLKAVQQIEVIDMNLN